MEKVFDKKQDTTNVFSGPPWERPRTPYEYMVLNRTPPYLRRSVLKKIRKRKSNNKNTTEEEKSSDDKSKQQNGELLEIGEKKEGKTIVQAETAKKEDEPLTLENVPDPTPEQLAIIRNYLKENNITAKELLERIKRKEREAATQAETVNDSVQPFEKQKTSDKNEESSNSYENKTIKFNYGKIAYTFIEGIGINGSYFINGFAEVKKNGGKYELDVIVNANTAASQVASVDFYGSIKLIVDNKTTQKKSLTSPQNPHIIKPNTFSYQINEPFILPDTGTIEIEIVIVPQVFTAEGASYTATSFKGKKVKIFQDQNK